MRFRVCVDAGHGGDNIGAKRGDFIEKKYTLALSHKLCGDLRGVGWLGMDLEMTRFMDEHRSLEQRGQIARRSGCNLAISIHVNNAPRNRGFKGLMAFHLPDDPIGKKVASQIARSAPEPLLRRKKWLRDYCTTADSKWPRVRNVLLPYRRRKIPSVLVECGFISNNDDFKSLLRESVQDGICLAIMSGINRYRQLLPIPRRAATT